MKDEDVVIELLKDIKSWLVGIWILLIALILLTAISDAAEPPTSALIEFTSAKDFQAKLDSIRAVCDTISIEFYDCWAEYDSVVWRDSLFVAYAQYDTTIFRTRPEKCWRKWYPPTIRCRTRVWAEIVEPISSERVGSIDEKYITLEERVKPGQAYVAWEWSER